MEPTSLGTEPSRLGRAGARHAGSCAVIASPRACTGQTHVAPRCDAMIMDCRRAAERAAAPKGTSDVTTAWLARLTPPLH
jgi:hypothetical protein